MYTFWPKLCSKKLYVLSCRLKTLRLQIYFATETAETFNFRSCVLSQLRIYTFISYDISVWLLFDEILKISDAEHFMANFECWLVKFLFWRTIELLQSHGEHDLVSQAANELANLYLHLGNTKSAFKWWKHSLDQVRAS